MNEMIESKKHELFKKPDLYKELGEFDRVAETFFLDRSILLFHAKEGEMVTLHDDIWSALENTDSTKIEVGDFELINFFSEKYKRDWQVLKNIMEEGISLEAPIVMKFGERYHLVSGNTRLMVARALGLKPSVFMFEIDLYHEEEI